LSLLIYTKEVGKVFKYISSILHWNINIWGVNMGGGPEGGPKGGGWINLSFLLSFIECLIYSGEKMMGGPEGGPCSGWINLSFFIRFYWMFNL